MDSEPSIPTMTAVIRNIYRRRIIIRVLSYSIFCFLATQFYLSTTTTTTTTPSVADSHDSWELEIDDHLVQSYSTVFQDLIDDNFLTVDSRSLAIGIQFLEFTAALKGIGVWNSKSTKKNVLLPYGNDSFDFQFVSHTGIDCSSSPGEFSSELSRTLKSDGYLVMHTESKDAYSLNSLLELFDSFKLIRSREITVQHWSIPRVREVVLKKQDWVLRRRRRRNIAGVCTVPACKRKLIRDSEPLMLEEPMNPSLKQSLKNIKYLTSIVDIGFKTRYVYIDVGARSYGSSIGGWFKKVYPKQDKPFKIFAVEADKRFHEEYKSKKKVTLVPYAAWVRNESLFFEINREPNNYDVERGRGMGRVQSAHTSTSFMGDINKIQGFDFADWVKNSFSEKDFVVVKMDVEGTEFDLVPKMVETGAICLIDEMFLECHYDSKQRCDGKRSSNYQKGYEECLELYRSLRDKGVLVHQWW